MKNLITLFLFFYLNVYSQGLIINEFSNGTSGVGGGVQEYIELLVIPNPSSPCANVNISGWIIDDNNGSFEGVKSGVGIAPGHFRIKSGCYTNLSPGSILLIYNANDKFAGIPADDPTDSNGDKIYIIPHTYSCIEVSSALPNTTSGSYTPATYVATTLTGTTSWDAIGMANSGDAVQVRRPDYSFFHGFSYGDITAPFPTFPAQLGGGSSFNIATGSGSGFSYVYNCGGITSANHSRITAASGTPGLVNSTSNLNFINNNKNCTIDWSNLSNVNNCNVALPILWENLKIVQNNIINISWNNINGICNVQEFNENWNTILYDVSNEVNFYSNSNLFRIENIDLNGNINYSPILEIQNKELQVVQFNNIIKFKNVIYDITVTNNLGQILYIINTDKIIELPTGVYYYYSNNFYKKLFIY